MGEPRGREIKSCGEKQGCSDPLMGGESQAQTSLMRGSRVGRGWWSRWFLLVDLGLGKPGGQDWFPQPKSVAVDSGSSLLPSKQTLGRWKESHPFRGARLEACLLPEEAPAAPFLWNPEPHMLSLSPTTTSHLLQLRRRTGWAWGHMTVVYTWETG